MEETNENNIKLLDCTLRDGGYINDWEFGNNNIINVFERLVSSEVDIIEVGFLDERRKFDENRSIMPDSKAVNEIYGGLEKGKSLVVGMIDYGTCGIDKLLPCNECFLDGIRVIFKKHLMYQAIDLLKQIKDLGYKVFAQAVSITSYNDEEFSELVRLVNDLEPYAFSLVDTYGLLHKTQLMHYYNFADEHLKKTIGIGYHAHNNFQLAYANCIELLENPPKGRLLIVDGTLHGMGKNAGNAPIELLAMYMNDNINKHYHNSQLLEAIDVTILDIYRKTPWGYSLKFFVAASHDCHPNYVTYLMEKKKLSIKSIHEILDKISSEKKLLYDKQYIEDLYVSYQDRECNDKQTINQFTELWKNRPILLIGPGTSIIGESKKINQYIDKVNPIVISINFLPSEYNVDFLFISNAKRYVQLSSKINKLDDRVKLIATSNVTKAKGNFNYILQYSSLLDDQALIVDNPMIMMLKVFQQIQISEVAFAGFDGFTGNQIGNYINPNMAYSFDEQGAMRINEDVINSIKRIAINYKLKFITNTKYDKTALEKYMR